MSEPEGDYCASGPSGTGPLTDPARQRALALERLACSEFAHNTRRGYRHALTELYDWLGARPLSQQTLQAYADHLRQEQGLSAATINLRLSAARWWARQLADLALAATDLAPEARRELALQAERAARVPNLPLQPSPTARTVVSLELEAVLEACLADPGPIGLRDAALIAVGYVTGLRRTELCRLTLGDLAPGEGGYSLRVRGPRGQVSRHVPVRGGAALYLRDWLALLVRLQVPGASAEPAAPLFPAIRKGGEIQPHGLGPQAAYERLKLRVAQAGVGDLTWEDARRNLATHLLRAGADLSAVQRLLGHASPASTSAYATEHACDSEGDSGQALPEIDVPYLRRADRDV